MTNPTIEIIKVVLEHPKAGAAVTAITAERIWVEYGSWIIDASVGVAGLVYVCLIIYRTILQIKKDKLNKE